ncbi:MAG: 2-C-methyl-D-erythritol 4-phosphate cytidylyltransferase [Nocardioidaceae bacterium]
MSTTDPFDEAPPAVGVVPVEGRGSLPFTLHHGEALVTLASWALEDAGVELLDFTSHWADVQARGTTLVVHDPLCPGVPVPFLREAVAASADGAVVVGSRPVTDTVKRLDDGVVGETVDRSGLVAVTSPVVLPPEVVAALDRWPDLADLGDLVTMLRDRFEVTFLEAPPTGRRVVDESDLALIAASAVAD